MTLTQPKEGIALTHRSDACVESPRAGSLGKTQVSNRTQRKRRLAVDEEAGGNLGGGGGGGSGFGGGDSADDDWDFGSGGGSDDGGGGGDDGGDDMDQADLDSTRKNEGSAALV